jgi:hypothetical protein
MTEAQMKINGYELKAGDTELTVRLRGKSRRYTYQGTSQTPKGRTVINLVGPINSPHSAFHACYVEDVETVHRMERKRPEASTSAR